MAVINDFAAIALALPLLQAQHKHSLTPALSFQGGDLLAIGPGTGLGGAKLIGVDQVIPCEPGQAGLSPTNPLELEIFKRLQPRWGEIYAELLVSGPGVGRLYQCLASIEGEQVQALDAATISSRALARTDELCMRTLQIFCDLLGSATGDFAISSGSYGGVYLAGGIAPQIIPLLESSEFLARFVNKAAMTTTLGKVPVFVITESHPGLMGAARFPLDR